MQGTVSFLLTMPTLLLTTAGNYAIPQNSLLHNHQSQNGRKADHLLRQGYLMRLLQGEEDPTFSIYTDESVPVKEVVSIMNIAKRNHYKVILATQPE